MNLVVFIKLILNYNAILNYMQGYWQENTIYRVQVIRVVSGFASEQIAMFYVKGKESLSSRKATPWYIMSVSTSN